jgi:hypothetical protein
VHFTCETGIVKVLVRIAGEEMCLVKPVNVMTAHGELSCAQSKGDPSETVYWNEAGTEVNLGSMALKISLNEGTEEGVGFLGTGEGTSEKVAEIMT